MDLSAIAPHERNASLLLTKRIEANFTTFKAEEIAKAIDVALQCELPPGYAVAYERWKSDIHSMPGITLAARFSVDGRLVTGLGAPNVLEFSVAMNRLWGMPVIPGSGLKGLASHFTRSPESGNADSGLPVTAVQLLELFGSEEIAGAVDWLEAWYIPGAEWPFVRDGNTPHYGGWYEDSSKPPLGHQDPVPSGFISVRGSFLLAVRAPTEAWAIAALNQLRWSLQAWGVGAKTNAGYGFLTFEDYESPWMLAWLKKKAAEIAEGEAEREARERLSDLFDELDNPSSQANLRAATWVQTWADVPDESVRHEVGLRIAERLTRQPSVFYKLTGRLIQGYNKPPGEPKGYMKSFLEWMDAKLPEGPGDE